MYYSATVVQMAGIGSASSAIWITAVIIRGIKDYFIIMTTIIISLS